MNYVWVLLLGMILGGSFCLVLGYLLASRPPANITISVKRP